jgi:hypothetical protein
MSSAGPTNPPFPTLPISTLQEMTIATIGLCDNMVGPWSQLLFEEAYRGSLSAAWDQLRPALNPQQVDNTKDGNRLRERIGLARDQLKLKLEVLTERWKRFKEKGTVKHLRRLLDSVTNILDSLAREIPGFEALKEFTQLAGMLIDKANE